MSARVKLGSDEARDSDGCENCTDGGTWRFLCSYHEGRSDLLNELRGALSRLGDVRLRVLRAVVEP